MGAYLKFSGFDAIIIQGVAEKPTYLYIHDGEGELRNASNLIRSSLSTRNAISEDTDRAPASIPIDVFAE